MTGIASDTLLACLSAAQPLELQGTALLQAHRSSGVLFPARLPRSQVQAAVEEVVAYTGRCAQTARRLSNLRPIPLLNTPLVYGL